MNLFSERSWAVIRRPEGAIALDAAGKLLIRLTQDEAQRIADEMSDRHDSAEARKG